MYAIVLEKKVIPSFLVVLYFNLENALLDLQDVQFHFRSVKLA